MKFQLLLYILAWKLKRVAKKDPRFRHFIESKKLALAIRAESSGKGRCFLFDNGRVSSTANLGAACACAMVWNDEATACSVMASSDDEAAVAALTEKKLKIEGSFKEFKWFSRALEIMQGKP